MIKLSLASHLLCSLALAALPSVVRSQASDSGVAALARRLSAMTAVTGYEQRMVDTLLTLLPGGRRDRAGNAVTLLRGRGAGRRLAVCPLDEPGYVVGGVRPDGYLTLRRAPGQVSSDFDQQLQGHRVAVMGRRGAVPGVVAVRSIHLTRGRGTPQIPFTVDSAYLDVGAASRSEVLRLGVAVLSPVTLAKRPHRYGAGLMAAASAGRRSACAALVAAVRSGAARDSVLVAFAVEHELSGRGLATLANSAGPFLETIVVDGRAGTFGQVVRSEESELASLLPRLGKVMQWSLGVRYPGTPVESVSLQDVERLRADLVTWIGGAR